MMITLKQIMVPIDFSEPSSCAVKYGRALAERFGATLHYVHVLEDFVALSWSSDTYVTSLPRLREEVEADALSRLGQLLKEPEAAQLPAKVALLNGNPFVEIVRYARDQDIDLIVIGTHGRGPIAHMLLGSVAEKVVRKAHCPVLTVRHPQHEFVMP
jgi:nucleotide-binding universal stress UspA family protein